SWLTSGSPIVENDIYDGETFDGRKVQPGWDTTGFDAAAWVPAVSAEAPEGELIANEQPPITTHEPIEAVRVFRPRDGAAVYDFGQNIAGWVRVRVRGPAGSTLTLKYSELIDDNGNIDPWTSR